MGLPRSASWKLAVPALLVAALLAGCGGSNEDSVDPGTDPPDLSLIHI